MAQDGVKKEQGKFLKDVVIPVAVAIATGVLCFALGTVRAQSAQETELDAIRLDIQKIRAMPEPSQVVTKDQLTEIVRRLDQRTEQISQDVQYLRQREEKRSK
jgi:hypothetical protein